MRTLLGILGLLAALFETSCISHHESLIPASLASAISAEKARALTPMRICLHVNTTQGEIKQLPDAEKAEDMRLVCDWTADLLAIDVYRGAKFVRSVKYLDPVSFRDRLFAGMTDNPESEFLDWPIWIYKTVLFPLQNGGFFEDYSIYTGTSFRYTERVDAAANLLRIDARTPVPSVSLQLALDPTRELAVSEFEWNAESNVDTVKYKGIKRIGNESWIAEHVELTLQLKDGVSTLTVAVDECAPESGKSAEEVGAEAGK